MVILYAHNRQKLLLVERDFVISMNLPLLCEFEQNADSRIGSSYYIFCSNFGKTLNGNIMLCVWNSR